jgi:hypothetical protein
MGQAMTDRFTGLRAGNARGALLGAASFVVVVVAVALVLAGVTSGEVAATVLFLPVFAAGFVGGRTVGYVGAAVATALYIAVRRDDLSSAGVASAGVLTLTRAAAYVVVAHVGALAQLLTTDGGGVPAGASRPRPDRTATAAGRRPADNPWQQTPEPAWDQVWDDEHTHATAIDQREPVLAGVGSPGASGYPYVGDHAGDDGYGAPPTTTMSGAWPPEPPREPWRDEPARQRPAPGGGHDAGAWPSDGGGDAGWPGDGTGQPAAPSWQAGDESGRLEDDSWAAVQQSWRQQHGVPVDDDRVSDEGRDGAPDGWPYEHQGDGAGSANGAGSQVPGQPGSWGQPGQGDGWPQQPGQTEGWPQQPGQGDGWPQQAPADGWPQQPGQAEGWPQQAPADPWNGSAPAEPWNGTSATPGPAGPGPGGAPADAWGAAPQADDGWGAAPADPWADAAPTGGTWPQPADPTATGGWPAAPSAPPAGAWDTGGDHGQNGQDGWEAPPPDPEPWRSTGQTAAVWDDPAAGHAPPQDEWSTPASPPGAGWAAAGGIDHGTGGFDRGSGPPSSGAPVAGPPPAPSNLPAVDPETGLWTAKFLRDRLTSERARSRRSGRSFSLVLVQVPDGPLAQLPYRRQLTLLRELGYQFVAGGVVDHLVHVPDQAQHWFAVILPDTDRSGAQVLERRLRLGIGGYLSSRGLRLHDLESASLTAPDDDPAMGTIWEALIGPDEAGSPPAPGGY